MNSGKKLNRINMKYVHGYDETEAQRLGDQSYALEDILHHDTKYPKGAKVLEAGCGVGAHTLILAKNSPGAIITSIDISEESVNAAKKTIAKAGIKNVSFKVADIMKLTPAFGKYDYIFLNFVLEHLPNPVLALKKLKSVLKPGGKITVVEGDHESTIYSPYTKASWKPIQCLIDLQKMMGGDSLIGRRLYPLLKKAGFKNVRVSPRFIYADASLPRMVDGFTKKTYIAMVEGAKDEAIKHKMITEKDWNIGIKDLKKAAGKDGVFCYTFFKAEAF